MSDPLTPGGILELGIGFWGPKALLSAVELGLFSELAKGPLNAEVLRQRLGLHPRSARDFFDALVSLGILERQGDQYKNMPETDLFLDRAKASYIGGFLEMANARFYPVWGSLTEGLRTGQPQNELKTGGNFFAALYQEPARLRLFLQTMTALNIGPSKAIAQKFPWKRYRTFVDVGTAQGNLPVQVALAHRHLSGVGLDLPPVGPIFKEYVASFGLSDRLRFSPGDFFTDPLPQADVLVLGDVLHDWSVDEKRMLLTKAYETLPKGGALIVSEKLIDDERKQNTFALLMSLHMLLELPGGFNFTGEDCCAWMREVGFREAYVEPLVGPDSMVVGIK